MPSCAPLTSHLPSREKDRARISAVCPARRLIMRAGLRVPQRDGTRDSPPLASSLPFGEKVTASTRRPLSSSVRSACPVSAFHRRTVLSCPPLASIPPSGEKATEKDACGMGAVSPQQFCPSPRPALEEFPVLRSGLWRFPRRNRRRWQRACHREKRPARTFRRRPSMSVLVRPFPRSRISLPQRPAASAHTPVRRRWQAWRRPGKRPAPGYCLHARAAATANDSAASRTPPHRRPLPMPLLPTASRAPSGLKASAVTSPGCRPPAMPISRPEGASHSAAVPPSALPYSERRVPTASVLLSGANATEVTPRPSALRTPRSGRVRKPKTASSAQADCADKRHDFFARPAPPRREASLWR